MPQTVVLEKTLETPLDSMPPDVNSQFIGKDPDAGQN